MEDGPLIDDLRWFTMIHLWEMVGFPVWHVKSQEAVQAWPRCFDQHILLKATGSNQPAGSFSNYPRVMTNIAMV